MPYIDFGYFGQLFDPVYSDKADFNTNAKSYYDALARNKEFLKLFTAKLIQLHNELEKDFEEHKEFTQEKIDEFQTRLDGIKQEMIDFFNQWLADGVLDEVINQDILNQKLSKDDLNIVFPKDFGVIGDGVADDTKAMNDLFLYLAENGGTVLFTGKYNIHGRLLLRFTQDVTVRLIGTNDSSFMFKKIPDKLFYDAIYAYSPEKKGSFHSVNLKIDGSDLGTGYGQQERTQGLTGDNIKNFYAINNTLSNIYGTGIFALNVGESVVINDNHLKNVWGYNPTVDSYGDGIYVARNIFNAEIKRNKIIRELKETDIEVGRCGIVLEFETKNATVEKNIIQGYNRGIHIEQTFAGHSIKHNTIKACPISIMFSGEKGNQETVVDSNYFSTVGYVYKNKPLMFYEAMVFLGPNEADNSPKVRLRNNQIVQVKTNYEMPMLMAINTDNVTIESNNEFQADPLSIPERKRIYVGSRNNIKILNNVFRKLDRLDLSFNKDLVVDGNEIQSDSILTDNNTKMVMVNNLIRPSSDVLKKVLGKRVNGLFNHNTIWDFSRLTIDNELVWNNIAACEVSSNLFVRTKTTGDLSPCTTTNESKADTLFTLKFNTIEDEVLENTRRLTFTGGWRYDNGIKVIYRNSPPDYGTWSIGDKVINTIPTAGGYTGWICVTGGTQGSWKGFGKIDA